MQDRRRFLQLVGAAAGSLGITSTLGAAVTACGGDDETAGTDGGVAAGNARDVAVGALAAIAGKALALGRDAGGFYALTTICTHKQCDIAQTGTVNAQGLNCSCHDSTFDANGRRTGGPAQADLAHYKVEIASNGAITIVPSTVVGADVRVSPA